MGHQTLALVFLYTDYHPLCSKIALNVVEHKTGCKEGETNWDSFCICLGRFTEWSRGNRRANLWSCVLPPHKCSVDLLYVWFCVE